MPPARTVCSTTSVRQQPPGLVPLAEQLRGRRLRISRWWGTRADYVAQSRLAGARPSSVGGLLRPTGVDQSAVPTDQGVV